MKTQAWLLLSALAVPFPAWAQKPPDKSSIPAWYGEGRYDDIYGGAESVSLWDLTQGVEVSGTGLFRNRTVRTQGWFEPFEAGYFRLSDEGAQVLIILVPEMLGQERMFMGKRVEVVGLARELEPPRSDIACPLGHWSRCIDPELPAKPDLTSERYHWPRISITIWRVVDLQETPEKVAEAPVVSLETLVMNPGRRDGQLVRVVGKFRGRNLYGDLPAHSQRRSTDWVIKDDVYAVWVVGAKPKGSGFSLDAGLKRDTGKWIEVVGRVETRQRNTYIRALKVSLGKPPSQNADAQPPPPPPERPKLPPEIVFSLPIDAEVDVPADTPLIVQFSKDMDEKTFESRVLMRYAGPVRPGDRGFPGLRFRYDGGRRALVIDPGAPIRPGRQVELVLLPGILDVDGLELVPRPGKKFAGAIDVLHFAVGF